MEQNKNVSLEFINYQIILAMDLIGITLTKKMQDDEKEAMICAINQILQKTIGHIKDGIMKK